MYICLYAIVVLADESFADHSQTGITSKTA